MSETNLREWTVHYVRARDAIERKLKNLEEKPDRVVAHYKDRDVTFLQEKTLPTKLSIPGALTLVTLQTKENFEILVDNFSAFSQNPLLTIIFVNPVVNEKWLIKPAVHHAVADKASLKTGLQAMFETVPVV